MLEVRSEELCVPSGWKVVRFDVAKAGEHILLASGLITQVTQDSNGSLSVPCIVLEKIMTYEPYDIDMLGELLNQVVVSKSTGSRWVIHGVEKGVIYLGFNGWSPKGLLDSFTYLNGQPCGILR